MPIPLYFFSDLAGTLTQDLRNRNPTLYTTKLRGLIERKTERLKRKTVVNRSSAHRSSVRRLLNALLKVVYQLAIEVVTGVSTIDGVVAVGVGELAEVLVGMH